MKRRAHALPRGPEKNILVSRTACIWNRNRKAPILGHHVLPVRRTCSETVARSIVRQLGDPVMGVVLRSQMCPILVSKEQFRVKV